MVFDNEFNVFEYSMVSRDDETNAEIKEGRVVAERKKRISEGKLKLLLAAVAALFILS